MNKQHALPTDFDPYRTADALQGVTEAMHWFLSEGPATESPMSASTHASLTGLSWLACRLARDLQAWIQYLGEAGIELPRGDEVREEKPPYVVN